MSGTTYGLTTGEILEGITAAEKRSVFLESRREELKKKYPDQYVAVGKERIVAVAKTMKTLMAKLKRKGLEAREVTVEFIAREDFHMII
ncbi:MAG: DUF5678 domain-containing protein [Thermoplasmata archaeon]